MFASNKRSTAERVLQSIAQLTQSHVFFAAGVVGLKREFTAAIDTMATDGKRLLINEAFAAELTNDEIGGTLAHEAMHVFLCHHTRRGQRDAKLWNVAADFTVNEYLIAAGLKLPSGALVAGVTKMQGLDTAKFKGLSAEHIYSLLDAARQQQQQPGWEEAIAEGQRGQVMDAPGPLDEAEAEAKVALSAAAAQARARGTLPGALAGLVEDMLAPTVSLYEHLERFLSGTVKSDFSWARPSRRHMARRIYLPSPTVEGGGHIVVGLDTSGSVPDRALKQFLGVLAQVAEDAGAASITIIPCDAAVKPDAVKRYEAGEDIRSFAYAGRGGTSFRPVFDFVRKNQLECDQMIFCTDLDCDFPPAPAYPVLWVSTTRAVAPFGKTVRI